MARIQAVVRDIAEVRHDLYYMRNALSKRSSPKGYLDLRTEENAHQTRRGGQSPKQLAEKDLVALAKEVVIFLEKILEAVRRVYQQEMYYQKTLPAGIDPKLSKHIGHLQRNGKTIDKELTNYLNYWKGIIEKDGKLPMWNKFNKIAPVKFIDLIIRQEKGYLRELWQTISAINKLATGAK